MYPVHMLDVNDRSGGIFGGGGGGGTAAILPTSLDTPLELPISRSSSKPRQRSLVPRATDLSDWDQNYYDMDVRIAAKIGFAFGGASVSGRQRVIVLEFARRKQVTIEGKDLRYGVAARLSVKASNLQTNASVTLPMLAVDTQMGKVQTESKLSVTGYKGDALAGLLPTPDSFSVERYVELMRKIGQIQELISKDMKNVDPQLLAVPDDVVEPTREMDHAVGAVWALSQLADGRLLAEAQERFPLKDAHAAVDAIGETYGMITTQPGETGQQWAQKRLKNLRLRS